MITGKFYGTYTNNGVLCARIDDIVTPFKGHLTGKKVVIVSAEEWDKIKKAMDILQSEVFDLIDQRGN